MFAQIDINLSRFYPNFIGYCNFHTLNVYPFSHKGIAKNLAEMMSPEMLIEAGLTRIIGSGACLSRNPVLRAEVQEIYQMPVEFTNEGSACIGAALAAIDVHYQKKSWWKTPWYLFL